MNSKYVFIVVLILALIGCQKEIKEVTGDQLAFQNEFPVRPDIVPGENSGKLLLKSVIIIADLIILTP